jgi:ATP-binding cassette subfamily B protein
MPPLLVAWIIDTLSGHPPYWIKTFSKSTDALTQALIISIAGAIIFGLESLFQWAYQYGFLNLAQKVQHNLRIDAYKALQSKDISFFENHRLGDTLAILNEDINQLERFLNNGFNLLLQLVVIFLFCIVVLTTTSWHLSLLGLASFPIIIPCSLIYQKKISPFYKKIREKSGELNSRIENNIAGMFVIKSFTAEKFEEGRVSAASLEYQNANLKTIQITSLYIPLIRMLIAISFAAVLFMGSYWILNGASFLTIGELVLFSTLIQRILWPMTTIGTILDDIERANASIIRIFSLLHTSSKSKIDQPLSMLKSISGKITFEDVVFQYPIGPPVLQNINLVLNQHEVVGIAGTTGSGKSTLIKLILRFYEPNAGRILLDNQPIQEIDPISLRKNIALVSQDVYLFFGSIYENIAYGLSNVTLDDIRKAAKKAELDDFVSTLPDGYNTIIGEKGIKLSGGQRQRLSIARAILKNSPIMIFDEATSSVDTETEKAIQHNIDHLTTGKTAIIIAHRLSTIRKAHRILLISNGKIIEEGTHDSLVQKQGQYAELWKIQIGEI